MYHVVSYVRMEILCLNFDLFMLWFSGFFFILARTDNESQK